MPILLEVFASTDVAFMTSSGKWFPWMVVIIKLKKTLSIYNVLTDHRLRTVII